MIVVLAIGGLLGYAVASGNLDMLRKANAEPPQAQKIYKTTPAACSGLGVLPAMIPR